MLITWTVSLWQKKVDAVDLTWSVCLGIAGVLAFVFADGLKERKIIVVALVIFWSLRLSYYLLTDRVLKPHEDGRYLTLREYLGSKANIFFFFFFQAQSILILVLANSYFFSAKNQNDLGVYDLVAVLLFSVSFLGESISDKQLKEFKLNPENKGKTCTAGLWRYSRHPNYFFEWIKWLSFPLLAAHSPYFAYSLIGPITMYFFLRYISGVPYTEKQALRSRKESYKVYQQETSEFFPWFYKDKGSNLIVN